MLPYQQSELLIFTSSAIYNCYFSKDWIAWEWEEKNIYILRCIAHPTPVHSPCLTLNCWHKAESGAQIHSAPSRLCCTGDGGSWGRDDSSPALVPPDWCCSPALVPPDWCQMGCSSHHFQTLKMPPLVSRSSFAQWLVRVGGVPHQANYDQ